MPYQAEQEILGMQKQPCGYCVTLTWGVKGMVAVVPRGALGTLKARRLRSYSCRVGNVGRTSLPGRCPPVFPTILAGHGPRWPCAAEGVVLPLDSDVRDAQNRPAISLPGDIQRHPVIRLFAFPDFGRARSDLPWFPSPFSNQKVC